MLSFLRYLFGIGLVIIIGWCAAFILAVGWMKWAIHFIKHSILN